MIAKMPNDEELLEMVFTAVRNERIRSNKKYKPWSQISDIQQCDAVSGEYREWKAASLKKDFFTAHGEVQELVQLMNVASKRIIELTKRHGRTVDDALSQK